MKKRQMQWFLVFLFTVWSMTAGSAIGQSQEWTPSQKRLVLAASEPRRLDVPYVPTPEDVVAEMLQMAEVGKNDVLYDLGCGDGRIVVMAAKRFGTRGIGIDLNPQRIQESKENAEKAKVTDLVEFRQQDLFKTDFSEASVLTLYLLPSVNLKLRPKILSELKPGTRVVSHDFSMGDWTPDQESTVDTHNIYYWVVPANVTGAWEWTMPGESGEERYVMQLNQKFQKVDGTLNVGTSQMPVKDAKLVGDQLQFTVDREVNGQTVPMRFEGRVNGHSVKGNMMSEGNPKAGSTSWNAQRNPSTVTPLDGPSKVEA